MKLARAKRHEGFDDGCDGETADGEVLEAFEEVAAGDFAVDEAVVEFDGGGGKFGTGGLHEGSLIETIITGLLSV